MAPTKPRECRNPGCDGRVILAQLDGQWRVFDAEARTGAAQAGCHVLVETTAWRLPDLIEHFMARFETPEPQARALALGYPFHRAHRCEPVDWMANP